MASEGGGVRILDGSQILQELNEGKLNSLFDASVKDSPSHQVTAAQCQAAALSLMDSVMCGLRLPSPLWERAFKDASFPSDLTAVMDEAMFFIKARDLLQSVGTLLNGSIQVYIQSYISKVQMKCEPFDLYNPLVVSILDGSAIKLILEDEDDFAMLAENLFTELDVEDTGKISPASLKTALLQMGSEMGVPPPSANEDIDKLVSSILDKHKAAKEETIGQAQFAKLLQETLESLCDYLKLHPFTAVLNINVNNGSQMKKLLADSELFSEISDKMFDEFDTNKDGKLSKDELKKALESHGWEWGLPARETSEHVGQLYDNLFLICDADKSGEVDKQEFKLLLKEILEVFAVKLQSNPVFVSQNYKDN
ncbi:hypothetical protein KP509_1Z045600 [Ceratopteris richardii]|nr:hypothetical protein KP509_1Z045600 [Ceratopteris richardii]